MSIMKAISLLLVILMVLTLFAACGNESENDKSSQTSSQTSGSNDQSDGESSEESQALVPHLKDAPVDVRGFELKILSSVDSRVWAKEQFVGYTDQEGMSDPVSVAVFERNARLEQEYGFTIKLEALELGFNEYLSRVRNDAAAGTADYHVLANGATVIAPLTVEGYCYDLYSLADSYLSLDEEWWDPVTQADMSIGNHLYMVTGDVMLLDDQFTYVMYFNKDLASKYNYNPYQLVYEGKWTMDTMYEMMKSVAQSGGDGVMDVENGDDTWGLVGVHFDTYQMIMGAGLPQVTKDANDIPVFAMNLEPNVNAFLKIFDIVTDRERTALKETYYRWDDPEGNKVTGHFYNGNSLFFPTTISGASSDNMRNAEIHYGILPMPKYNENQDNYASTINPYHFFVLGIPTNNVGNLDKITFCLEAMSYLSREQVTNVYYELTLKLKRFADDDDSPEMLDIIFRNRLVDISIIFDWGGCIQYYNNLVFGKNKGIISYCESIIDKFNSDLQDTLDAYEKLAQGNK